ncbi:hypothetical protein DFH07DRAFT_770638 [Mycena maculata]|uniref:Uncharacterized protein n=1 Tax=Mycena maculata TaxID=230809 RepID=A0AAD7JJB5_9AGAR|nr:hypothetical protein DFH07DRAFT_770638 [Mycena maculata]
MWKKTIRSPSETINMIPIVLTAWIPRRASYAIGFRRNAPSHRMNESGGIPGVLVYFLDPESRDETSDLIHNTYVVSQCPATRFHKPEADFPGFPTQAELSAERWLVDWFWAFLRTGMAKMGKATPQEVMDMVRDPALAAPGIEATHGCAVCETRAGPALADFGGYPEVEGGLGSTAVIAFRVDGWITHPLTRGMQWMSAPLAQHFGEQYSLVLSIYDCDGSTEISSSTSLADAIALFRAFSSLALMLQWRLAGDHCQTSTRNIQENKAPSLASTCYKRTQICDHILAFPNPTFLIQSGLQKAHAKTGFPSAIRRLYLRFRGSQSPDFLSCPALEINLGCLIQPLFHPTSALMKNSVEGNDTNGLKMKLKMKMKINVKGTTPAFGRLSCPPYMLPVGPQNGLKMEVNPATESKLKMKMKMKINFNSAESIHRLALHN